MPAQLKLVADKVYHLPLKNIQPDPNQPRVEFDHDAIKDLASSIKARGVEHPILVRQDSAGVIIIKDGHRRFAASQLAKQKKIPALLAVKENAIELSFGQVAINQHHEKLTPMELARWLAKLAEEHKLTPTQISARLEKEGIRKMGRSQISNLMRLVDLPEWAQTLLNEGKIEASAARSILAAKDSPVAMGSVQTALEDQLEWNGEATVQDVERAVNYAYRESHIDLTNEVGADVAHFDYKKICKGCEHLKVIDKKPYCLNDALFTEHNEKAKADGLGPFGGKQKTVAAAKAARLTPAELKKKTKATAAKRADSLADKCRDYLHGWWIAFLGAIVQENLRPQTNAIKSAVLCFFVLGSPGEDWHASQHKADKNRIRLHKIALEHKYHTLADLIAAPFDQASPARSALALALIKQLEWAEVRDLAVGYFGKKLAEHWRLDRDYLELLQKAELVKIAEANYMPQVGEVKKGFAALKRDELLQLILDKAPNLPPPALLQQIYATPIEREPLEDVINDLDDVQTCGECGCTEDNACEGGCTWVEDDLCSACVPAETTAAK